MLLFFNNAWHENKDIFPILARLSSGQALFETIHFQDGVLYFWEKHLKRMEQSLAFFKAAVDWPDLKSIILQKLENADCRSARVKLVCTLPFEGRTSQLIPTDFLILIEFLPEKQSVTASVRLKTMDSPFNPEVALLQHKTINYGYHFYFKGLAQQEGFDDVLYLHPKGFLMETSMANIIGVKGDKLFTPPSSVGLLPGIVRSVLIQELEVIETKIHKNEIAAFDYFFLTSSVRELRFVEQIDRWTFAAEHKRHFLQIERSWQVIKQEYRARQRSHSQS